MSKAPAGCVICFPDPCECGPKPKAKKSAPRFKAPPAQGKAAPLEPASEGAVRPQPNGPVREAFDPTALDAERTTDRWAKQAATRSEFDLALDALVSVMHPSELEKYGRRAQAVPSAAAQEWRNRHAGR